MHRVAKGIEDGCDFLVDAGIMPPDIGHRQRDEFSEGSGAVDANARGVGAKVAPAREAIAAAPAGDMAFAAHDVAGIEVVYVRANLDNLSHKLMPDGHRHRDGL